jgi:hypothetical protein
MRVFGRWNGGSRRRAIGRGLEDLDPHLLRDIGFDYPPNRAEIARALRIGRVRRT